MTQNDIAGHVASHGLRIMGVTATKAGAIVLLGPDNPQFWNHFCKSPEAADSAPHPLDRWSERVIGTIASKLGAEAHFPFGGPPYAPFLKWAAESGEIWPSPIGPFVGAETGLWVSFRGALEFPFALEQSRPTIAPCPDCAKPCKNSCPVDAFAGGVYDVARCRAYLRTPEGHECLTTGCKVRSSCPVGPQFAPSPAQAFLHMKAFRDAGA